MFFPSVRRIVKICECEPPPTRTKETHDRPSINNLASLKDVNETEVAGLLASRSISNGSSPPLT